MQRFLLSLMPGIVSGILCAHRGVWVSYKFSLLAVSALPLKRKPLSPLTFLQHSSLTSSAAFTANASLRTFLPNSRTIRAVSPHYQQAVHLQSCPSPPRQTAADQQVLAVPSENRFRSSFVLSGSVLRCTSVFSPLHTICSHFRPFAGRTLFSLPTCTVTKMGGNRVVTHGTSLAASTVAGADGLSPAEKVAELRHLMRQHQLDAYVVYSADAHGSEVPAPCDWRRGFLTNFDGSSGAAVVTPEEALLWTDGRYFVQAEQQLDLSVWKLMKRNTPGYPTLHAWLAANEHVCRVGLHGWSTPAGEYTQLLQAGFLPCGPLMQRLFPAASKHPNNSAIPFPPVVADATTETNVEQQQKQQQQQQQHFPSGGQGERRKREVVILDEHLVDQIWGSSRPARNLEPLAIHPLKYAGEKTEEKLQRIAALMRAADADVLLLSALDDVAWLLNLRGSDIPYARVFYGYCLIVRHPQSQSQTRSSSAPPSAAEQQARKDEKSNIVSPGTVATAQSPPPLLVLYAHPERVTGAIAEQLAAAHVDVRPYNSVAEDLQQLLSNSAAFYASVLHQSSPCCESSGAARLANATHLPASNNDATTKLTMPMSVGGGAGGGGSTCSNTTTSSSNTGTSTSSSINGGGGGGGGNSLHFQPPPPPAPALAAHTSANNNTSVRMIWMDSAVNVALYVAAHGGQNRVMLKYTPAAQLKAIKNTAELEGMKEGHIIDGVVLCKFFLWLEQQLQQRRDKVSPLNEWTAAQIVDTFRAIAPHSQGSSFPTIASVDANAAIVHYRPRPTGSADLTKCCTFLLDSGGFYRVGCTTDVTRTVYTAQQAPEEQRRWFTLVLKGFIALSRQRFPQGTRGPQLDILARQHLWALGVDYRHGTGHGVGSLLNVHEGPIGISPRLLSQAAEVELDEGNVLSIEPGYYVQDAFGIRIENLAFVKRAPSGDTFKDTKFFEFEQLTMVPIQKKFILPSLLSKEEIQWLNNYHAQVWDTLSPRLKEEQNAGNKPASVSIEGVEGFCVTIPSAEETLRWLKDATEPLVAT